ncbi:daunorubicin resistance protein DrrA family ABC transporter ATP-binding protein [Glycomyces sp. NRRL B-16210]|uniref:daunorubicin resistance protein DrrA family ABC transporter ATP-binding protein n=1 Tax=Glycomyces sp. NRRL B-16210 TaxID=1463821 RepID=UPI0004C16C98|nr:daunorubicin resistance protein DrrA family ABC transporter ATP-binding protein [Glycomyces sp. NRRL B-16210]
MSHHDPNGNAIEIEGLTKRFGDLVAVDDVDLTARTGTVLGLLGPNGAGKTTVVRMLATLSEPTAGTARVGGYDIVRHAPQVRSLIGLTGQFAGIDELLTGEENLRFIGRLLGMPTKDARARANELLAQFNLSDAADKPAKAYSGGMRRRLDLAASLVGRPRILFLDEPTTGLDPRARGELWGLVRDLVADGTTVLLTTQYLEEADQLAHEIVVIDRGKVIATGTPTQLKAKIGGQTLRIQPEDHDRLDDLRDLVAQRHPGLEPMVEAGAITIGVNDDNVMPALAADLRDRGIALTEFHLGLSSLDEVFLTLTGRRTETDEPENATEEPAT